MGIFFISKLIDQVILKFGSESVIKKSTIKTKPACWYDSRYSNSFYNKFLWKITPQNFFMEL